MADVKNTVVVGLKLEDQTQKGTQSARSQLKSLREEMLQLEQSGQKNTQRFRELQAQAGGLADQIGDTQAQIKAMASDTRTLDTLLGVGQGLAGAFAVAQGAAAMFGEENEDMQKAMMKVQGALSMLNGVMAISNVLNKDSAVMVNLNTASQKAYKLAVDLSNISLKTFRGALIATGIGAAVVALGLLIANFDKLTAAVKGFLGIKVKPSLDAQIASMERMNELAKAKGETDAQMYQREEALATLRIQNAKNQEERNEAIHARNILRATEATRLREEETAKQEKLAEDAAKKQEQRQANAKKQAEERAAKEQEVNDIIAASRQALLMASLSENERELEAIDQSFEERLAKVKGNEEATNLVLDELRVARQAKLDEQAATAKQKEDERLAAELEQQKAEIDYKLAVENEYYAELQKIQDKAKEDEEKATAAKIATFDFYSQHINAGTSALYAMMEGFGKSGEAQQKRRFNITKQLSIATTLIDTYVAAQKAYLSQMQLTPDSPIRAVIAAAAAVAAGLGRVAKIKSQQFTGGGGGTSDAGGGGSAGGVGGNMGGQALPPPTATNPNAQLLNPPANGQGQGMRAYVVESDIRSVSGRLRRMSEFATLGA